MSYTMPEKIKEIEQTIAQFFGVTIAEMHDGTRNQPQTLARQFVCWYLVEQMNVKTFLPKRYFSLNSASITAARKRIYSLMSTDFGFRKDIEMLCGKLDELTGIVSNFDSVPDFKANIIIPIKDKEIDYPKNTKCRLIGVKEWGIALKHKGDNVLLHGYHRRHPVYYPIKQVEFKKN